MYYLYIKVSVVFDSSIPATYSQPIVLGGDMAQTDRLNPQDETIPCFHPHVTYNIWVTYPSFALR
jgi:hypothetical protein